MTEDETFTKLKQLPYDEMFDIYSKINLDLPPVISLGYDATQFGNSVSHDPYAGRPRELVRHYRRLELFAEHGWTIDEFMREMERREILEAIEEFNKNVKFPPELLKRALHFFPSAKFIEAKIELE